MKKQTIHKQKERTPLTQPAGIYGSASEMPSSTEIIRDVIVFSNKRKGEYIPKGLENKSVYINSINSKPSCLI